MQFILLVANKSKSTPVFLTQENSSFGYYDLSLELEIDGETYPLTRREVPWYRNIPVYDEISPGSSLARPVSLNPYEWEGFPGQYFNLLAEAACGKQQADNVRLRAALKNGFIRKNGRDVRLKPKVIYSDWNHVRYLEKQDDGL